MASSNYVGARSIEELAAALQKFDYTPRNEQQRRQQSENLYRTQLEQALRNAQQTYEDSDLALANQLIGLDTGYNRQRQSQEEAIRSAVSQADRHALSRGMQRSTYNNATLANIQNKGDEALARIEENRENDRAGVEAQRAQLARNLARTREGANADYQNQVVAEMQRLADEDYQRKLTADQNNNSTQLQLYATQQAEDQFNQNLQLQRDKMAQDQKQFEDQMWFNRQKEGLGWSTAADAQAGANGSGTGEMSVGEQNKAALLNSLNGMNGGGRVGVPMLQAVDGGESGYDDGYAKWLAEQQAAKAGTAPTGSRPGGSRVTQRLAGGVGGLGSGRDYSKAFTQLGPVDTSSKPLQTLTAEIAAIRKEGIQGGPTAQELAAGRSLKQSVLGSTEPQKQPGVGSARYIGKTGASKLKPGQR